jgi:hypothetical protein
MAPQDLMVMNNELKLCGTKQTWLTVRHCFGIFLEVLAKTTKESQSGYSMFQYILVRVSYLYSVKSKSLPIEPTRLVFMILIITYLLTYLLHAAESFLRS